MYSIASNLKRKQKFPIGNERPFASRNFKELVTSQGHHEAMTKIQSTLTKEQKKLLKNYMFFLLKLEDSQFNKVLAHSVLLRDSVRGKL